MQTLKKLIILLNLLSMSPSLTMAAGTTPPSCDDVLNACGEALKARDKELDLSKLAVQERTSQVDTVQKEYESDENKLNAFYRNPVFLIVLGFAGGYYPLH